MLSSFPEHFAASHVLHRLLAPRHPPYALPVLTKISPLRSVRTNPDEAPHAQDAVGNGLGKIYSVVKDRRSPLPNPDTGPREAGPPSRGGSRITSYNVCYTKLLRPMNLAAFGPSPASAALWPSTAHRLEVSSTQVLKAPIRNNFV